MRTAKGAVDRIAAPLLYLVVALLSIYSSVVTPFHNWDAIAYMAAAESFEQRDSAELQRFAYDELRKAIPTPLYEEYAQESTPGDSMRTRFRHALRTDPAAFEELLSFYRVRPIYNAIVFLAYKAGINIELATHLISGVAIAIAMFVLYAAASAFLWRPFVYVLPMLALAWGVVDLARYSTPDGLSFLAAATIVLLFLRGRLGALLLLAPLALGVRTDLILFTVPLLAWLFVFGGVARWKVVFSLLASALVYAAIVRAVGNAGWSTFFYCSAIERCIHPLSMPPTLRADMYWAVLAGGTRALLADLRFDVYALLLAAFCSAAAFTWRRRVPRPDWNASVAVTFVCAAYVIGRFLVLPNEWWRFFTAPYVLTTLALLALLSAGLRSRRNAVPAAAARSGASVDHEPVVEGRFDLPLTDALRMTRPGNRKVVEVQSIFGPVEAFADDLITDQIVAFGAHTRPELAFLLSVVDSGDDVFDLGGHIGSFAIPLARKIAPHGRIVVVEGLPETFAVLERNLRRHALQARALAVNALIAPRDQRYVAQSPGDNSGASFFLPTLDGEHVGVGTTTLDALCHAHFFPRLVKIDLEGFEMFALAGANDLLATRPIIYAEVAGVLLGRAGSSVADLEQLLAANGYRYFRNSGDRNAAHDRFVVVELPSLDAGGEFFDVLAVHRDDERIGRLLARL